MTSIKELFATHPHLEDDFLDSVEAAELSVQDKNIEYSVVYIDSMNTIISMPSQPPPSEYGYKVLTYVSNSI